MIHIKVDCIKRMMNRGEQGSSVVQFALISVLFFTLVFGIIEFGILMFDNHILTNASREGARAGIIMKIPRVTDAEIEAIVNQFAEDNMVGFDPASTLTTTVTPDEASRTGVLFGVELEVTVTYPYKFLFLSGLGLGPINLTAETRMRME